MLCNPSACDAVDLSAWHRQQNVLLKSILKKSEASDFITLMLQFTMEDRRKMHQGIGNLEGWLRLLSWRTQVQIPAPIWWVTASVTLVPGDPTPSSGFLRHTQGTGIHAGKTPILTKTVFFFKKK